MTDNHQTPMYVEPYKNDDDIPIRDRPDEQPVHETDISDSLIGAVRRAYRDSQVNESVDVDGSRRLKFTSGWHDPLAIETMVAIEKIGRYNRFNPEDILDMLTVCESQLGDTEIAIAREGSPALYFWTDRPRSIIDNLNRFNSPDELQIAFDPDIYPFVGTYKHDNSPDTLWVEDGKVTKHVTLPNGERVLARYGFDSLPDRFDKAVIRAWWD